ncbi:MAG: hypothetical protein ACQESS_04085 [Bacillota bacterium]
MRNKIKNTLIYEIYRLSLPEIWLEIILPLVVGAAAALKYNGSFNIGWFMANLINIFLVLIAVNSWIIIIDSETNFYQLFYYHRYYPSEKDYDRDIKIIQDKKLFLTAVLSTLFSILALILTAWFRSVFLIWIIMITAVLLLMYIYLQMQMIESLFDEFLVGLINGPALVLMSFVIQTGEISIIPLIVSLPLSILIVNIRWLNQHKENYLLKGLQILLLAAYASFALIFAYFNSIIYLLLFLTFPYTFYNIKLNKKFYLYYSPDFRIERYALRLYYISAVLLSFSMLLDYLVF